MGDGGRKETESHEIDRDGGGGECSYVWDDASQLYFHARSGFYHEPYAGWYYSSRDGVYYKFENGSYVLLENYKEVNECDPCSCQETVPDNPIQEKSSALPCYNVEETTSSSKEDQSDIYLSSGTFPDDFAPEGSTSLEAGIPPPTSEWLEETLFNLYLSGYKQNIDNAHLSKLSFEVDGASHDDPQMLKDGDPISADHHSLTNESGTFMYEEASKDEENWQAQYGQVVYSGEQPLENLHAVDLWDWTMVADSRNDGDGHTARLIGRLVKSSAKLHPSMPSGGGLFRTSPICEAYYDLVRVRTGQVYRLRNPSRRYLASKSSYDSSNPTLEWGFPELTMNRQAVHKPKSYVKREPELTDEDMEKGSSLFPNQLSTSKKQKIHGYRDRAAERRTLHGGFGVGPGQKRSLDDDVSGTTPFSSSTEEAAAEALNMSFGAGSYARRMLENMGWKEGEALGNSRSGLIEPIEAAGNTGNAGLGWSQPRLGK